MAFDQSTRNRLQKFVNNARTILIEEFTRQLQATYGLDPKAGAVADVDLLNHLDNRQRQIAHILRDTLAHYLATTHGKGEADRSKQALSRVVREQAFTVLNRLVALRMAEARGFLLESIAKGYNSKGFQLYKQLAGTAQGETGDAYRNYLYSVFDEFSLDLAVLFDRHSAQGRLFPRESALLELLDLINHFEIEPLWAEDEAIGWIYQYFNSQEERKKMRAESQAPRNSRELAVRNQFFTPRYVVNFLTDNTLGRIWYEMTRGNTRLVDICHYLVRRPTDIFLTPGKQAPVREETSGSKLLSQEELLKQPVYIPHRAIKDPRCIRILDPACGSMHFGLYAFDLFECIYEEAWQLEAEWGVEVFAREDNLQPLLQSFDSFKDYKTQIPRLIIEHNIHGVDIDPRAVQIAGLSLWQRAQRAWQQQGIKPQQRPVVKKSNIVCAEPMPGDKALLKEFTTTINPPVLGQLVEVIFDKMQLAGEAGTLLKIEEEIQSAIHQAREQWQARYGTHSVGDMFQVELDEATSQKKLGFDLSGIDDEAFWDGAEQLILEALSDYADTAESNSDQKQLFAEDAAKGFAFIDLCSKRFDVVLMNPPFGELAASTSKYGKQEYSDGKDDIGTCFVLRGAKILTTNGKLGAITNRTYFSIPTAESWRTKVLLGKEVHLSTLADLGYGVLDDAMVEAASYVISKSSIQNGRAAFFNILESKNKEGRLKEYFQEGDLYPLYISLDTFKEFPGKVICHWLPLEFLENLPVFSNLREQFGEIKTGLNTGDDFRFLRLVWEVDSKNIHSSNGDWELLSKGGEYSPFGDDFHLVINWRAVNDEMKHISGARLFNKDIAFSAGIVYPMRTTSDLSPRALPSNVVFNKASQFLPVENLEAAKTLILLAYTRPFKILVEALYGSGDTSVSGSAARNYTGGVLNALPIPNFEDNLKVKFVELYDRITFLLSGLKKLEETSLLFDVSELLDSTAVGSLISGAKRLLKSKAKSQLEIGDCAYKADTLASSAYGFTDADLEENWGLHPFGVASNSDELSNSESAISNVLNGEIEHLFPIKGTRRVITKKSYFSWRELEIASHLSDCSPEELARNLIENERYFNTYLDRYSQAVFSAAIGLAYGRWPNKSETSSLNFNDYNISKIENDFGTGSSVSVFDNGQLIEKIGENLPDQCSETLIKEFCGLHNFDFLEDYLRNGYFEFHLKNYSNSRRQAPIYWSLQTLSASYTLWIYYHRLNAQTLYTCVNDFVEPKFAEVEQDINALSGKLARSSQEEKELAQLTDLASELRDFRDELLRVAKFWRPNLNDGVQITAAPLWKLFQHKAWQKKLKETWGKLEKGDYDWAHLACSIWPERVLRKCLQDRSLAITHDVEDLFWHEVEVPVKRGKKATGGTKLEWQPKELTDAELNALIQVKIKEVNA